MNTSSVLVVDDTKANVDVLLELLGKEFDVSVAMDGESALAVVDQEPPDLILLDIMMDGMDGFEVCRMLKSSSVTREIPVIFLTAMDQVEDEIKGLSLGAADYITKPFNPPVVLARVRNHLELQHSRRELKKQNEILRENAELREDVERMTRHDLKGPLNAVINVPRFLLEELAMNQEQEEMLVMVEKAGLKMLNLINQSLDLYRMEQGLYAFKPVPVDLLKVVNSILRENMHLTQQLRLEVEVTINGAQSGIGAVFTVLGEEMLCYSMFSNLIKNAVEASPKEGKVTIDLRESPYADSPCCIAIHNAGQVPPDIHNRFFDKYATAGKHSGTGLGTYSAKLMAEIQNGNINMRTCPDKGTTITVELPVQT
ncbi:MAG: hybrid sensor histidine kinase/response regulator [Desulfovibrio sp.]|nr:MAG: hybrid sensor histidine kinase/response regulator [Desulfovibrio sp.]